MQEKQPPLLEIKNLSVEFTSSQSSVHAVRGISYCLYPGEVLGIVGESGSGKSVSSYCILGILPENGRITKGQILFDNQDLTKMTEKEMVKVRGKEISMIFQDPMTSLDPVFTIGYQIEEILKRHTVMNKKLRRQRVCELLELVGISQPEKRRKQYPHEFSGGMRQRVMIAMALACNPRLLIADEPTTALDVTIQAQILTLLKELKTKLQMSMIFITHDLGVVSQVSDRIAVMQNGKIVEEGMREQILFTPRHAYTKMLLKVRTRLEDVHAKRDLSSSLVLDVQNVKKQYGKQVTALDGVSFQIRKGEIFGLVGESGCGKSTLGKSILRLQEVSGGNILFYGENLCIKSYEEMRALRGKMQIVFQDPYASLNPSMSVGENIREGLAIHNAGRGRKVRMEQRKQVTELLKQVGLDASYYHRYPQELSGGQRQRVGIARALAVNPQFIIWDESVSALDVSMQAQILDLIQKLQIEKNLTYLFISHDMAVVKKICDRVGVMYRGQLVEITESQELFAHPKHPYTKLLLSAIPKMERGE